MSRKLSLGLVLGQVTLGRFATVHVPQALRAHVGAFQETFAAYEKASSLTEDARVAHVAANDVANGVVEDLMTTTNVLAAVLANADPSTRLHPFQPFGGPSPGKVVTGTRARTAKEVQKLAKAVLASKPKKSVADAATHCAKRAGALAHAHDQVVATHADLVRTRQQRNACYDAFATAYETTKFVAKRTWKTQPGYFEAVFGKVQRSLLETKTKRKGGAAAGATPPTDVQPATGTQPVVKAPANAPAVGAPASGAANVTPSAPTPTTPAKPASTPASTANGAGTSLSN
jgi:hypothetical protein